MYAWIACFGLENPENDQGDITTIFEVIFSFSMFLKFMTSYIPEGEINPVKNINKIAANYICSTFKPDVIALFPFVFWLDPSYLYFWRLFYLLKIVRIVQVFKAFSIKGIMDNI